MDFRTIVLLAFLATQLAACATLAPVSESEEPVRIQLIALNDFHGHLGADGSAYVPDPDRPDGHLKIPAGGAAYLATAVAQLRAQSSLNTVVAAGDLVGASPLESALFADEPTIEALNLIGLEYSSVGNHEFDRGVQALRRLQAGGCNPKGTPGTDTCMREGRFEGAAFRYLAANVTDRASGQPLFPPYAVKRFPISHGRSIEVGFIGIVLRDVPSMVTPSGVAGLEFADEAATINRYAAELDQQGVDAVVVLIHEGVRTRVAYNNKSCEGVSGALLPILDRLSPRVNLVISGHSHWAYVCRGQGTRNPVLYTSAGLYGLYLTDIDLRFDPATQRFLDAEANNIVVTNDIAPSPLADQYPSLSAEPQLAELVAYYQQASAPLTGRVVGSIAADFTREEAIAPGTSGEYPLGDLVADAMLAATQNLEEPAQIAITNLGGLRANLLVDQISGGEQLGEITYGEVVSVMPFGNTLVTLSLSGSQIYGLLAQQWVGQKYQQVLQVSEGFTFRYDPARPDGSNKLVSGSVKLHGVPIDPDQVYRITTNSFLAEGGDSYTEFRRGTQRVNGPADVAAFVDYLQQHPALSPQPLDRISILR